MANRVHREGFSAERRKKKREEPLRQVHQVPVPRLRGVSDGNPLMNILKGLGTPPSSSCRFHCDTRPTPRPLEFTTVDVTYLRYSHLCKRKGRKRNASGLRLHRENVTKTWLNISSLYHCSTTFCIRVIASGDVEMCLGSIY